MRGRKAALAAMVALLLVAGGWLLWPKKPAPAAAPESTPARPIAEDFSEVEVRAAPGQSGLTLRGRIEDPRGAPIPGAEVHLVAALQPRLGVLQCPWKEAKLLGCDAAETVEAVRGLLEKKQGLLRPALTVRTDAEGAFAFEGLSGVSFTVWATSSGYGPALVDRAAPGDAVTLVLPEPRTLGGRVLDPSGRGLAGVQVWAVSRKLSIGQATTSGAGGDFRFDGLGEGPFYVMASAEGLMPAVALTAIPEAAPVELRLQAPQTLNVRVFHEGAPAPATVLLEGFHLSRTLEIDDSGQGRFTMLEAREAVVRAASGALASERVLVQLRGGETTAELHLIEGGTLWVTATDTDGQPIPMVELSLHQSGTGLLQQSTAEGGEGVSFGPIAPGDYWLSALASGFERQFLPVRIEPGEKQLSLELERGTVISGRVVDIYGRGAAGVSVLAQPIGESTLADATGAFSITVPSAGQYTLAAHHSDWGGVERVVQAPVEDLQLSLEPGASIQVQVELEGRPVEGASVRAWADPQTVFTSDALSGPDGVVWMRGMEPGTYSLFATHPEHLQSVNVVVSLGEGEEQRVTVQLREGAGIRGVVVDQEGRPVPDVGVLASGSNHHGRSDSEGQFKLGGFEEGQRLHLYVHHPDYDLETRPQVTAGQEEPVRIVVAARESYRGRVVSAAGERLPHFTLDGQRFSHPDGHFEVKLKAIQAQETSRVLVTVEAPGHQTLVKEAPADQLELGTLVLEVAPRVKGRVIDASGSPVGNAVVSCMECRAQVLTEMDGRFELEVPDSQQSLHLNAHKGRQSAEREVELGSGPVELTLNASALLEGTLLDAQGAPLAGAVVAIAGGGGDTQMRVTGEGGRFTHQATPAVLRIAWGLSAQESPPMQVVRLPEEGLQLTLGRAPGTSRLSVEARPVPGWIIALVRGTLPTEGSIMEGVMRADWARLAQRLRSKETVFDGVPPGQYTLVYGPAYSNQREDLQVRSITVRGDTHVAFEREGARPVRGGL